MSVIEPAPTTLDAEQAIAARTPSRVKAAADEKQALHARLDADDDDGDGPTSADGASDAPPEEFKEGGYGW